MNKKIGILKQAIGNGIKEIEHSRYESSISVYSQEQLNSLKKLTSGLHEILNAKTQIRFSVLICIHEPNLRLFELTIDSLIEQSANNFEVLIGFAGEIDEKFVHFTDKVHNESNSKIKFEYHTLSPHTNSHNDLSLTLNDLAERATGNWLILLKVGDWVRPDFIYRLEQTLHLLKQDPKLVLYCNEYQINKNLSIVKESLHEKPLKPEFPFVFFDWIGHCLTISKETWNHVGGLNPNAHNAEIFDLQLRLDLVGAKFLNVPFSLLATQNTVQMFKPQSNDDVTVLKSYLNKKGISWNVTMGPFSCKIHPPADHNLKIHVIVPFKNQRAYTLRCAEALLNQKNVKLHCTFVDNRSTDKDLSKTLSRMGFEVIPADFPFNYSKINNFALSNSQCDSSYNLVLFLNNDVFLNENAIYELALWAHEPMVGAIGAQLLYPDGTIQHSGVDFDLNGRAGILPWHHTNIYSKPDGKGPYRFIRSVNGVTAACMMMRKDLFFHVNKFDEDYYPIAFSDTNLCVKIRNLGKVILYTPYAFGEHHESVSRGKSNIEDYEVSRWLHELKNNGLDYNQIGPFHPLLNLNGPKTEPNP